MLRLPLHVPPPSRVRNPDATGRRWLRRCIEAEARAAPPPPPRAPTSSPRRLPLQRPRHVFARLPVHDHRGAVDLRLQDGALTDGERVLGRDLALHLALDTHRALEGELAVHPAALAEERARPRRLLRLGLFPLEHLHLPGRRVGRRRGLGALAPLLLLAIPPEERHSCCRCIGVAAPPLPGPAPSRRAP